MKTFLLSSLVFFLSACGTSSKTGDDSQSTTEQLPPAVVSSQSQAAPVVSDDTDSSAAKPSSAGVDYREGLWAVGLSSNQSIDENSPCRGIHGAVLGLTKTNAGWAVGTSPVVFAENGSISWIWPNGNVESWNIDGHGTFLFVQQNISCLLDISP